MEFLIDLFSAAGPLFDAEWDLEFLGQHQGCLVVLLSWLMSVIQACMVSPRGLRYVNGLGLFCAIPVSLRWRQPLSGIPVSSFFSLPLFNSAKRSVEPLTLSHRMHI